MKMRRQATFYGGQQAVPLVCNEDEWSDYVSTGLFFPTAPLKFRWDLWMLVLIVYSCVTVPFRLGMGHPAEGAWWDIEVAVSLCFIIDVGTTFNTAYMRAEDGLLVLDREAIRTNYLRGWFVIDMVAALPFELADLLVENVGVEVRAGAGAVPAADGSDMETILLLRVLRLFRLMRLLRLLKLRVYMDKLEDTMNSLNINLQLFFLARVICGILYLMHILGCFWFFLADGSLHEVTWLSAYGDPAAGREAVWEHYLLSIYWALTTLTTVGYGDIVPQNDTERAYALCTFMTGALVFGFLLSTVADLVKNADPIKVQKDKRLEEVKHYLRWHRFPPELVARVKRYFEFYLAQQSAMDEEGILDDLAPALRRDVQAALLSRSVQTFPLLRKLPLDAQLQLHAALRPMVREPHEVLVEPGEKGAEGGYCVCFMRSGIISAVGSTADITFFDLDANQRAGACIGEHALMARNTTRSPSTATGAGGSLRRSVARYTYVAKTRCELYTLPVDSLAQSLQQGAAWSEASHGGGLAGSGGGDVSSSPGTGHAAWRRAVNEVAQGLWKEHLNRLEARSLILAMYVDNPFSRLLITTTGESEGWLTERRTSAALRIQAYWLRHRVQQLRDQSLGPLSEVFPNLYAPGGLLPLQAENSTVASTATTPVQVSAQLSAQLEQLNGRLDRLATDLAVDREQQAERIRLAVREAVAKEFMNRGEITA